MPMDRKALLAAGCMATTVVTGVQGERGQAQVMVSERATQLELTVIVYSETDVPWLSEAQASAAALFEDAGIRLAWIACATETGQPPCHGAFPANELVLRVRRERVNTDSHACGVALRPVQGAGSYITLFLDCVIEGSKEFRIAERIVAAYCLAHEIAHLLLPTSAHAASGIMQARLRPIDWERAARGGLRFFPDERRQMVDALRRRIAWTR
jgi:hypothetical protein